MTNPLVAERKDSTQGFSGVPILESVDETRKAIESGDWAAGVLGAVGTGLDALGMALDPFGAILAAGVGWLMEHVGPVSDALDSLTGDPDEIKAHSETWKNIGAELAAIAADMTDLVDKDTAGWTGQAGDAYRARSADTGKLITAAQSAAEGASSGIATAGEVVGAVRTLVRDIIAELVGHLVSWALQVVATLGIGLTWVVPQVVAEVAKVAAKIADITMKLVKAMKSLMPMLKKLGGSFDEAADALKKIKNDSSTAPPPKPGEGTRGPAPNGPDSAGPGPNPSGPGPNSGGPGPSSTSSNSAGPDSTTSNSAGPNTNPPPDSSRGGNGPGADTPSGGNGPGPANTRSAGADGPPSGMPNPPRNGAVSAETRPCKGDPVDVSTGEVVLVQRDLALPNPLELVLERTHLSGYRAGRWFGPSWTSTADQRLEVYREHVCYFAPDGVRLVYPLPAVGAEVLPLEGARWALRRRTADTYVLSEAGRERTLEFAPRGRGALPLVRIADDAGNSIDFEHDERGAPRRLSHSAGYLVDLTTSDGRITAVRVLDPGSDLAVAVMRYDYDGRGRLVGVTDSSGVPQRFHYDDAGRMTGWEDRNGGWYRYVYDSTGRCVRTVGDRGFFDGSFSYDRERLVTTFTDSLGNSTEIHLNAENQVLREVGPLGATTSRTWDRYDRLLSRTDPLGRTTGYEWDAEGELAAVVRPDSSRVRIERWTQDALDIAVEGPDGRTWRRSYSGDHVPDPLTTQLGAAEGVADSGADTAPADALADEVTAGSADDRTESDLFGRPRVVVDRDGGTTQLTWNVEGRLLSRVLATGAREQWQYDREGNQLRHVGALGQVTGNEYGRLDLLTATVDATGARTTYDYDTEARLVAVTNPNGQTWRYTFDAEGRIVEESDFDDRVTRYAYDAAGQLLRSVNAAGEQVEYGYDVLGNVVWRRTPTEVATFAYDPVGRLVEAANGDATITVERDERSRVTAHTVNGLTVAFRYDDGGGVHRRTPSGVDSSWTFDDGRPAALRFGGHHVAFTHDERGRQTRRQVDDAWVLTQTHDAEGRLTGQAVTAAGNEVVRRSFGYRPDGALAAVDDSGAGSTRYELDAAGRVTEVLAPGRSESYRYDGTGNLTASDTGGGLVRHRYQGNALAGLGAVSYEHDAQGRLVLRRVRDAAGAERVWRFTWNALDRLTSVVTPDGTWWAYRYDPLGRRIAKQRLVVQAPGAVPAVAEQVDFVWDGTVVVEQRTGAHVLTWEHHPDDGHPVAQLEQSPAGGARFTGVVTDQVGSPVELVDAGGSVVRRARCTLWGLVTGSEAAATPLRFPGQHHDAETGLHYNVYRYYDPVTARYLSPDPLGLEPAPNAVAYVPNPLVACDPLGLVSQGSSCATGGDGGGGGRGQKRRNADGDSNHAADTRGGPRRSDRQREQNIRRQEESGGRVTRHGGSRPAPTQEPSQRGTWNERSRPGYNDGTKDEVLDRMERNDRGDYKCQGQCDRFLPEQDITIDHVRDWKTWIKDTAAPDESGKITSQSAKDAYSDIRNLEGLCGPCNSSKNGPKGVHD
ncbi:RHS repeat-associated core domain-containing protein [Saccharopolyspora erythraea]|uniref:RHS repeat-associated core domain-containing protein n=1 Tax=Saccharopolyspora erythraea TaxID=1836 RepID=UPI0020133439|nr:RHS repeat-associated core domain-containing protein [Saccharopolyspora erythraea]